MKQLFIISCLMVAFIALPLYAQEGTGHHPQQMPKMMKDSTMHPGMKCGGEMMQGKMMGKGGKCSQMKGAMNKKCMMDGKGMMFMHPYWHVVKHLPDMKEELDLSPAQVELLKNTSAAFLKKNADWEAGIEKKQIDLKLLFDKNAPAKKIRETLNEIMDLKLNLQTDVYETAQKMVSALNTKQKEKWQGISKKCMPGKGMKHGKMMK